MKETPIPFRTDNVRAILDGRKTQTRRVKGLKLINEHPDWWDKHSFQKEGIYFFGISVPLKHSGYDTEGKWVRYAYGQAGDLLWGKETWQDYCPLWQGMWCGHGTIEGKIKDHQPVYKADPPEEWLRNGRPPLKWSPSIFMPKWAARIWLEITGIRVERLQDIADADCEAEGVRPSIDGNGRDWRPNENGWHRAFRQLWDSINSKSAYSWDANPWVWVIVFKRAERGAK